MFGRKQRALPCISEKPFHIVVDLRTTQHDEGAQGWMDPFAAFLFKSKLTLAAK
jgi:hypothetical protein